MKLYVSWKNHTFQITINENKTLLDLKKEIAKHFNESYTGFAVMNGNDLIDQTKNSLTLKELDIRRLIRLPKHYVPGNRINN